MIFVNIATFGVVICIVIPFLQVDSINSEVELRVARPSQSEVHLI